jgi:hypothetical protein
MVNKDWSHWLREDDGSATVQRIGAQAARQDKVKFGGVTKVQHSPDLKMPEANKVDDGKGSYGLPKTQIDRNNRPNDHRPSHIDYPSQKGPSNPVQRLGQMWQNSIEAQTKRAQKMQRPGNK